MPVVPGYDPVPAVRVEKILNGDNIEPATRLEYFLKQAASGGGDALPIYDNSDIGKVLTVVSEYETTGEAIQSQSVELVGGIGTLDAEKVDVSNWTDGQLVSVVFNGTPYVLELSNIEGSISCGNEYFQLYYNSGTGVMNIESLDAVSPVTVSAQYLTEHANADWAETSGGSLKVAFSYDVDAQAFASDKTFSEIKNALSAGKNVYATLNSPAGTFLCTIIVYDIASGFGSEFVHFANSDWQVSGEPAAVTGVSVRNITVYDDDSVSGAMESHSFN